MNHAIAAHLHTGCRVAIADGCGAPIGLGPSIGDAAREVGGVRVLLGWSMTAPIDVHDRDAFPDVRTVMAGYALRVPVREGRVHSLPVRLGSVPRLVADTWRPDVLVAALRPGARGLVFGSEVGWMRAAVDAGATVLAEINHGLPDASDGVPVPAEQVVIVAETDRPPHPFTTTPPDDVVHTIAAHAARLVPTGAVIQYGPGTVADTILRAIEVPGPRGLRSHRRRGARSRPTRVAGGLTPRCVPRGDATALRLERRPQPPRAGRGHPRRESPRRVRLLRRLNTALEWIRSGS